jgi:DNA-3-methyladenine glycosylase II
MEDGEKSRVAPPMRIQLRPDGPLDVEKTLARYRVWGEDPANRLIGETFCRVLSADGKLHGYELRWSGSVDDPRLTITVPGSRSSRVAEAVTREVSRLLFLHADLPGFYRMAKANRTLRELVQPLYGLRPTLAATPFEMLVGAIIAQQVNLPFAVTIRGRLVRRFGRRVRIRGQTVYAFPEPALLARARVRELRAMQFSTRKAEYVVGLARQVASGTLDFEHLAGLTNEEVIARLTKERGLGRWTAEWFLARALGRGDVCPAGDLAVRKAFAYFYARGRPLSERAIRRRAGQWGPYQNLAVHYLLAGLRLRRARAGGGT